MERIASPLKLSRGATVLPIKESTQKRVLVVDDEESIRLVVQSCLEDMAGWEVLAAPSGAVGLEIALAEQPDAIVLDVMMPGMDGLSFLSRQQTDPQIRNIPTILLTAKVDLLKPDRYLAYGAVGAIAKPFDPLQLILQIEEFLQWG
jgi:CheY-like chemotaxis protein